MAQTIKLKRSATQGATPTTSQLALGEVAINTYDGKMYIKKDVGGTESIVEIGTGSGGSGLASSFTLYEYTATANQTTFSGSDSNSNTLAYDTGTPPKILVYLNGVLLDHTTDYTATTGTSVVLTSATAASDLVQVAAYKSTVSTTLDIDLTDNQKLLLGTDDDLEIYHNGTNSVINQTGTGDLLVQKDETTVAEFTVDGIVVTGDVEADEFIGDLRGAVLFKAQAGESLAKGEVVYISGISGNTTIVSKADADDASKMPAFGLAAAAASANSSVEVYTSGTISGIDTSSFSVGDEVFTSTTAGALTATPPTGESSALQKIGKVTRSHASSGSLFIIGAGRSNAVPNLNEGRLFVGNSSNQAVADDTVHVDIANSRVGVGTTSPNNKLTVTGAGDGINLTGSGAYLRWNSGDMMIKNEGSYKMGFYTYNSSDAALNRRMVIDTNGNVGIGTTTPGRKLTVQGASGDNLPLRIIGGSGTNHGSMEFQDPNTTADYKVTIGSKTDDFYIQAGGTEKVRVLANGNVGIGTTSPSQKLSVNGNIYSIGGFVNASGYQLNGTYVVDSSRNLVNIGTISSGTITSSTGTVGISPNTFKIVTSTEANTAQGDVYAALEFHVTGAENSTGTLSDSAISAIKAIDYRSGTTSFEDAGLGFYTVTSSDSAPVFRGGFANAGGLFLSVDGNVDRNTGAGDLYADSNIEAANNLTFNNQFKKGSDVIINNSSELLINTVNVTDSDFVVLDNNNTGEINIIWRDHSADRLYLGTTTDIVEFRGNVNFQSGHTLSHDGNVILDSSRNLTNIGTISSGAITSTGALAGTVLTIDGNTAINQDGSGTYMILYDGGGGAALYAGNTSDNRNYYQSNHHRFRSDDANTNFAEISSVGMIIGASGPETNMGKLHVKDSDSGATPYQNGNGGITIERNGRAALNFLTPNTQDAYVFFGDPESANAGYVGYNHSIDQAVWKSGGTFRLQGGRVDIDEELRIKHSSTVLDITGDSSTNTYFASTGELRIRPNGTTINKIVLNSSYINAPAYQVGGTEVIDSSRNITAANITTSGYLAGPATFTIDPAAVGDNTGTVVIAGNLQVDGTTTTINSTTLTVDDLNITLASGSANSAAANGAGITVDCGSGTDATFTYNGTLDTWEFNKELRLTTGSFASPVNTGRYLKYRSAYAATAVADFELKSDNNTAAVARITGTGTADLLQVFDNTSQVFTIEDGGKVGIGTGSPVKNLHVNYSSNDTSVNTGNGVSGGVAGAGLLIQNTDSTANTYANLDFRSNNADGRIAYKYTGTTNVGDFHFITDNVGSPETKLFIKNSGYVGINNTDPTTYGTLRVTQKTANNVGGIAVETGTVSARLYVDGSGVRHLTAGTTDVINWTTSGNVGIGETDPDAKLQVEELGIDTTTTSTSATTQVAIDTFAAATFRSARYTIQVTNSTDSTYHITEILLIHDGTTPQITEYGTIFTGSAEATFDADISSSNVRLLATPATTDSMTFKVVRHCITV